MQSRDLEVFRNLQASFLLLNYIQSIFYQLHTIQLKPQIKSKAVPYLVTIEGETRTNHII